MAIKLTFSVDDETVDRLARTAERLHRSTSQVVREAIRECAARADRLTEVERLELLSKLDECLSRIPEKPAQDVDRELDTLGIDRRTGAGERARDDRSRYVGADRQPHRSQALRAPAPQP